MRDATDDAEWQELTDIICREFARFIGMPETTVALTLTDMRPAMAVHMRIDGRAPTPEEKRTFERFMALVGIRTVRPEHA